LQFKQQGIWPTAGLLPNYIENVFSTYLYTGTGASQPITNGVNLSTYGGLVWIKQRDGANQHILIDSARGISGSNIVANSASTGQPGNDTNGSGNVITSLDTSGFTLGTGSGYAASNVTSSTYVSWTFRKQAKFFDIVTYTGTGSSPQTISHNLGSTPGCIIVKRTDTAGQNWYVYHSGTSASNKYLILNRTDAEDTGFSWNPTSTTFNVSSTLGLTANGGTYVAYLFASNAGGFGNAGTDNVITCGSAATDSGGNWTATLGYEPQWILWKSIGSGNWEINDTMRGASLSNTQRLFPNLTNAETDAGGPYVYPTATGFVGVNGPGPASSSIIYIAIRRGPMATPTVGTSVYEGATRTGTGANATVTTSISPVDMAWITDTNGTLGASTNDFDRLRGANKLLQTSTAVAEISTTYALTSFAVQAGYTLGTDADGYDVNYSGLPYVNWSFKRAPGFFDEVCYTGTGSATTFSHNLGIVPEMMIVKRRSGSETWSCYNATIGATKRLQLNSSAAEQVRASAWNNTAPTSSVFTVGTEPNVSGQTYVMYLFATVAGVSKVGSFTGTGGTQTINCGFGAGGARWLMVKRTDSTGDWYVFDSARGFTSSSSPYLLLNLNGAQVTGNNGCYADSTGFTLTSNASATVNISAASYIFLAIA
jgi:hypothetical protein